MAVADIRRIKRVWVLAWHGIAADVLAALTAGCTVNEPQISQPFELWRLEDCAPP